MHGIIHQREIYPVDSIIQPLNNWGQLYKLFLTQLINSSCLVIPPTNTAPWFILEIYSFRSFVSWYQWNEFNQALNESLFDRQCHLNQAFLFFFNNYSKINISSTWWPIFRIVSQCCCKLHIKAFWYLV